MLAVLEINLTELQGKILGSVGRLPLPSDLAWTGWRLFGVSSYSTCCLVEALMECEELLLGVYVCNAGKLTSSHSHRDPPLGTVAMMASHSFPGVLTGLRP